MDHTNGEYHLCCFPGIWEITITAGQVTSLWLWHWYVDRHAILNLYYRPSIPTTMSSATEVEEVVIDQPIPIPQYPKPPKKLKPARKQVKAGDVVKTETVQTGKEYSELSKYLPLCGDNKAYCFE